VNGDELVSVGADGLACVIEPTSGVVLRSWQADFLSATRCFLRPGGEELITAGIQAGVAVWRSATGVLVHQLLPELYRAYDYVVSPDGSELVLARAWTASLRCGMWAAAG